MESDDNMSDISDFESAVSAPDRLYTEYDRGYDDGYTDGEKSAYASHQHYLRDLLKRFRDFSAQIAAKLDAKTYPSTNCHSQIWSEVADAIAGVTSLSSDTPDRSI